MATTPEEFFTKDLTEQPPASPPVFPDLPQKPNGSSEGQHHVHNDMMLPYISRMLMEDNDGDNEFTDHPALFQVQQPFVQILRSLSFIANTDYREGPKDCLHEGHGGESGISLPLSNSIHVVGPSFECMDEANNMFLPKDDNFIVDEQVNQIRESNVIGSRTKKRYNRDHLLEEEVRSTRKAAVMMIKEPEEKCGSEMLDKMMLHAYETCITGMERVTLDNTGADKRNKKSGRIKSARKNMVDIGTLLMSCAQALAENDHMRARELLMQIKQHASATGNATRRLAHCFTKGLEARIVGKGSQVWQLLMLERPSIVEFLKAFNLYNKACCFLNVTFIFSTMTIMQAMVGKCRLHIVDYGMCYGFQWAGLLRLLASKEGGLPEVKFTTITGPNKLPYYPSEQIEETRCRLMKCAHELGFPLFKFQTIMKNWEDVSIMDLHTDVDEVLVVSDLFSFSILMEESIFFDSPSPRDTVLNNIKRMRPDVFIQSVSNRSYGSSFLSRFREMLFYYMALFDMVDATIPRESKYRSVLEQVFLGHYFFNDIACEGVDLLHRPEKYKQWQTRNQRAGLRQLPLKSSIVKAVEDEVTKHYHKDFMICQDGQWLLQGWMGRVLYAHTAWVAEDASS